HRVPFVQTHDQSAACLGDETGDVGILVGNTFARIDQQQHDVGGLDGLQRLDDRELFHGLEDLAPAAQAGGVDQRVATVATLEFDLDGVARGSRQVVGADAVL